MNFTNWVGSIEKMNFTNSGSPFFLVSFIPRLDRAGHGYDEDFGRLAISCWPPMFGHSKKNLPGPTWSTWNII